MTESRVNSLSEPVSEALIIQNMSDKVYYPITIFAYILCIVVAISVDDLSVMFDYIAAFAVSGIQFLVPGLTYILLSKQSTKST